MLPSLLFRLPLILIVLWTALSSVLSPGLSCSSSSFFCVLRFYYSLELSGRQISTPRSHPPSHFSSGRHYCSARNFSFPEHLFSLPLYHVFRYDRSPPARGGGLLIAVNRRFSASLIAQACTPFIEYQIVELSKGNFFFRLVNVYCKRGVPSSSSLDCIPLDNSFLHIIVGDFNASHVNWDHRTLPSGTHLLDWSIRHNLVILNEGQATHIGNTGVLTAIDVTLCDAPLAPECTWKVTPDTLGSDHFPVSVQIGQTFHPSPKQHTTFSWQTFNACLQHSQQNLAQYDSFQQTLNSAIQASIVQHTLPTGRLPWWTPACSYLRARMRRCLHTAHRKLNCPAWDQYKKLRQQLQQLLSKLRKHYWSNLCIQAARTGNIYRILKKYKRCDMEYNNPHLIISHNNQPIMDAQQQANVFITHYASSNSSSTPTLIACQDSPHPLGAPITPLEFQQALNNSKNCAAGADGITNAMIRNMNQVNRNTILQLFNTSLQTGLIPMAWTHAIIHPILKPGKEANLITSYRPISVTSNLIKIMERVLLQCLISHTIFQQQSFHKNIHGFLPHRGTNTLLMQLHQEIITARKQKKVIYLLTLDIKDAYGSVWINGLLQKLLALGISKQLVRWIFHFLTNRTGQVKWRNCLSTQHTCNKGLPQGCVLSAFLFALYVYDLPHLLPPQVKCRIYADDFNVTCTANSCAEANFLLQQSLNTIIQWCTQWKLTLCLDKCKFLNLSSRKSITPAAFSINDFIIPQVSRTPILGVIFDQKLTWAAHFVHLQNKGTKALNCFRILASTRGGASACALLRIGHATVRSILEYGYQITHQAAQTHQKKLDTIYNSMLRTALGLPIYTPLPILYAEAGVASLQSRKHMLYTRFLLQQASLQHYSPIQSLLTASGSSSTASTMQDFTPYNEILDACRTCHVHPSNIIPWTPPTSQFQYAISTHDFPFQHKTLPSPFIQAQWQAFINSHPNAIVIGTDGSKTQEKTSIGISIPQYNVSHCQNLPNISSIFTAEALAIQYSIDHCIRGSGATYFILSDSKSVLTSLKNCNRKSPCVILRLHQSLNLKAGQNSISLFWIPGHKGIHSNELADRAAKKAHQQVTNPTFTKEDLLHQLNLQQKNINILKWQLYAKAHIYPHIHPSYSWFHHSNLNRTNEVLIRKFRTNTLPVNAILYKIGVTSSPNCHRCNCVETLEHVLFHCPSYAPARLTLFSTLPSLPLPFSVPQLASLPAVSSAPAIALFLSSIWRFLPPSLP